MKWLLDTHLLLWAAGTPEKLPVTARMLLEDPDSELVFRTASLWEIAIKRGLDRPDFQVDARVLRRGLLDNGYQELPAVPMPFSSIAWRPFTRTLSTAFSLPRQVSKELRC